MAKTKIWKLLWRCKNYGNLDQRNVERSRLAPEDISLTLGLISPVIERVSYQA